MRLFTPYSSTASGPPSLTREGSRKSCFWAIDGGAICNRYDIGPPRTSVPTIRKNDRKMCGGDRYDLGSSRTSTPTIGKDRGWMRSGTPFYTLLIHRKRSPFPHKGRLL